MTPHDEQTLIILVSRISNEMRDATHVLRVMCILHLLALLVLVYKLL